MGYSNDDDQVIVLRELIASAMWTVLSWAMSPCSMKFPLGSLTYSFLLLQSPGNLVLQGGTAHSTSTSMGMAGRSGFKLCSLSLQQSLLFTGYYIYLFYHPQRGFLSWLVIAVRRNRYFFKLNIFSNSIPNLLYSSRKVKVKLRYVFTIKTKYVLMT